MDTVVSLVLLVLALGVIGLFVGLVLRSFSFNISFNPLSFLKNRHSRTLKRHLEIVDAYLVEGKLHEALQELERGFVVGLPRSNKYSPELALAHNLGCLERIVQISHKRKLTAANLGELERLFDEQARLISAHKEVSIKHRNLKRKNRWHIRKRVQWANDEFSKKLEELAEKVAQNSTDIRGHLKHLIHSLESPTNREEVTLH